MSPPAVHAAARRSPATVALDLRLAGRAAAVAVDGRGALLAWSVASVASGPGDAAALARRAVRELRVRPKKVLVLLGAEEAQVAVVTHAGAPDGSGISAALYAEGYERLSEPSVAALAVAADVWLVSACGSAALEPLAAGLLAESGAEPAFVVDQLLAVDSLEEGSALVEWGETGLLVAAAPPGSPRFARSLPAACEAGEAREAARECRESLEAAGFEGPVRVCGPHRGLLSGLLAESGLAAHSADLPASGGETLPPACELAWRLALRPTVPPLTSPRGEKRRESLAWARRVGWIALGLAILGGLAMAAGLRLDRANRDWARASRAAGDERLVQELRELGELAGEAERLRTDLAGRTAPWPRLTRPVAEMARRLPPEVGWERLQIRDGVLELEASAAGASPLARLELLRHALQSTPGIVNLSWEPPVADPLSPRLRQVFRASLGGAPAAAPRGAR